ncbi:hypothetical protein [Clostridium sp.]|uniref:hypothetical protein n=1 Tax=Clostridium sp. TaxID=1506 RepID=UPI00260F7AF5|nr:hypothetical protein [Clostridium sp.]
MKNSMGKILYLLGSVFIFVLITTFAVRLIVYLLPIIAIIYLIYKLYGFIKRKFKKDDNINIEYKEYSDEQKGEYDSEIDDENTEIIDVEYEEIDK